MNPNIIGENSDLSSALQSWHKNSPNSSITSFLRSRGFNGFALRNLNVPFTPDIYEKIIERRVFKESTKSQVGVSSIVKPNELIEIFVAFV